jgi:hypothetical protein
MTWKRDLCQAFGADANMDDNVYAQWLTGKSDNSNFLVIHHVVMWAYAKRQGPGVMWFP